MNIEVASKLLSLNFQFYQNFARQFSATRQRIQPGVRSILRRINNDTIILDIGCGNGNLWRALNDQGYYGKYVGVDYSPNLLNEAIAQAEMIHKETSVSSTPAFRVIDLSKESWFSTLPLQSYNQILCFAVLHHLPQASLRLRVLRELHYLLAEEGKLAFSVWQIHNSPRLSRRIQDWSIVELSPDQLEEGDVLIDWKSGGKGLRYVHQFGSGELEALAEASGFQIDEVFSSDGKEGNLGLYHLWAKR